MKNKNKKGKKAEDDDSDDNDVWQQDGANQVHYNYKLILIGNSEVGKTSVSTRFLFETFEDQERSTNVKISHKPF